MSETSYILPDEKPLLLSYLDRLPSARKWKVSVKLYRRTRTDDQNKALWGVAYKTIREATGNDVEDLHTLFCGEYFGWVETEVLGKRKMKPARTTTTDENGKRDVLSTVDFADFYTFIQAKASEFGIDVPDPDPNWRQAA